MFIGLPSTPFILFGQNVGLFFLHESVPFAISERKGKYNTPYYYFLYYFYEHVFVQNQTSSLNTAPTADSVLCTDGLSHVLLKSAANFPLTQVGEKVCLNN